MTQEADPAAVAAQEAQTDYDPREHLINLGGRGKGQGTRGGNKRAPGPMTPEHRAKISAALKRYAARPDSHLRDLQKPGEEHPNWQGGIKPEYYRDKAFRLYGRACQRCGSGRHITVHHKDRDRRNSTDDNLEVLCRSCHMKEHHDEREQPRSNGRFAGIGGGNCGDTAAIRR
jgi:5-methylcytosine-specific restriction endonuclease McrA